MELSLWKILRTGQSMPATMLRIEFFSAHPVPVSTRCTMSCLVVARIFTLLPTVESVIRRLPQPSQVSILLHVSRTRRVQRASTVTHCVRAVLLAARDSGAIIRCSLSLRSRNLTKEVER